MKLKWPPRLQKEKLGKLYRDYMAGLAEDGQMDDVGIALLLRCEAILRAGRSACLCPNCGRELLVDRRNDALCPCGFEISYERFKSGIQGTALLPGCASENFRQYLKAYPAAQNADEKMICIDTLIHSFHVDLKFHVPNRITGNNLIEGSLEDVAAYLDTLSGVQPENDARFQETLDRMWRRRRGQKVPPP